MTISVEALASLFVEPAKKEEFLNSLKNESGEYLAADEVLPLVKQAHKKQLEGRRDYGISKRSEEIEDILREAGIKIDKGEKLESVLPKLAKAEPTKLTDEDALNHPAVKKAIDSIKKEGSLTPENAMQNPIVAEKVRLAVEAKDKESLTVVENLRSELKRRDEEQSDNKLKAHIRKAAADLKLNLGDDDSDKETALETLFIVTKTKHKNFKEDGEDFYLAKENGDFLTDDTYGNKQPLKDYLAKISPFKPVKVDKGQTAPPPPGTTQRPGTTPPGDGKYRFNGKTAAEVTAEFESMRKPLGNDFKAKDELGKAYDAALAAFQQ